MYILMINQIQQEIEPIHLPKIKPPTKKIGDPKPKSKNPNNCTYKKIRNLIKIIFLFLILF